MDSSSTDLATLLARTRLVSIEESRALYTRWRDQAPAAQEEVPGFTSWLIAQGILTEYQSNLLKRGHTGGYFLEQYKILDRIGRGRMAGVYKGVHNLGQVVAIKVLPPSRAKDPLLLARFQREARLVLRLNHPNVVRGFHMGEASGLNFLVMEYLVGETLEDVLNRRGKLPPAEAVRLIHQVLLGLQHIHEQGLIHRDLKPSNLMLIPAIAPGQPDTTLQSVVKILDIGLGRVLYDENTQVPSDDPQLTGAGVMLGTPDYMAPEQARDARSADIRADIYSAGCVLYHLLAGQPPFPDVNLISQMIRHATEPARPVSEFSAEVSAELQQVLDCMLAKEPAQRYATPERAAQALRFFWSGGNNAAETTEYDPRMRSYLQWVDTTVLPELRGSPVPLQTPSPKAAPVGSAPTDRATAKSNQGPTKGGPVPPAARTGTRSGQTVRPGAAGVPTEARIPKPRVKPAAAPPPATAEEKPLPETDEFDVELVLPQAVQASGQDPFHLTRRDFAMLGIGAGGVLSAVFVGWLLSHLLHPKDLDEKTRPGKEKPEKDDE